MVKHHNDRNRPAHDKRKTHKHECKGARGKPCGKTVECDGNITHSSRCPRCTRRVHHDLLFETPAVEFL